MNLKMTNKTLVERSLDTEETSWVDEDLILREKSSKQREPHIFWVTEIAGPCLRAVYFDRKIDKPPPLDLLRIFNSGRVLESWWMDLVNKRNDVFILGKYVPCLHINSFYRIHGRADVFVQREYGKIEVHEIKTIKSIGSWLDKPKPEHVNQLQFYLNILGVEAGSIDYINKFAFLYGNDIIDHRFSIQRDDRVYKVLLSRTHELFGALMADIPPPKEKCWKCEGYCSYQQECERGDF